MKIDLMMRSRYPGLLKRFIKSVDDTSKNVHLFVEDDDIGNPRLVQTYTRLFPKTDAEIVGVAQDDLEFLDKGWDSVVKEIFAEYKPDILGIVGSVAYKGGGVFDAGSAYGKGMICGHDGVRIFSLRARFEKVKVVDGCLMFMDRKFLERTPLDKKFDGLFYWDIDLCLRASKVGVGNILVRHSKTKELYGHYPETMKPRSHYEDYFESKHGLQQGPQANQMCCCASLEDFRKFGRNECLRKFEERFLCASPR